MANLDSRVMELESANRKPGQSITRAQWQQLTPGDKKARHLSILSMLPIAEDQDDEGLFYLADLYRDVMKAIDAGGLSVEAGQVCGLPGYTETAEDLNYFCGLPGVEWEFSTLADVQRFAAETLQPYYKTVGV